LLRERDKIRKSRPKFRRQESWRYKRLKTSWRKHIGIDNSMRHHKRGIPTNVRVGFRGPKATRGLTRTGMEDILIHNINELEQINNKSQVARIASKVGTKKKVAITNRADELEIKIINRPEEALTFATISEISEELLLEEDDKKKTDDKKVRKKRTGTELSVKELEELEKIEAEIKKKTTPKKPASTTKKATTTKKPTTTTKKTTTAKKPSTATAKKPTPTTKKPTATKKTTKTTTKEATTKKPTTTAKKSSTSTTKKSTSSSSSKSSSKPTQKKSTTKSTSSKKSTTSATTKKKTS
ncbi:MAG: 50S ribosomal protein L32e, partial [Asgard group archaeon]|nr:50S ribosomal protein L32e [Asgard group archaeon]